MTQFFTKTFTRAVLLAGMIAVFAPLAPVSVASAQAVGEAKIILVDFNRVTTEALVGQDVAAQLESNRVKIEGRASELDQALAAERADLERQQSLLAPDAFEERVRAFSQRQLAARTELEQLNAQHQRAAQQASLEIQRTLRPIILNIMEERGATIVLDKLTVYHSVGGLDATTQVIEKLDGALSSFQITLPSAAQAQ